MTRKEEQGPYQGTQSSTRRSRDTEEDVSGGKTSSSVPRGTKDGVPSGNGLSHRNGEPYSDYEDAEIEDLVDSEIDFGRPVQVLPPSMKESRPSVDVREPQPGFTPSTHESEPSLEDFVIPTWWNQLSAKLWHSWAFDTELFRKEGLIKYGNWLIITWFAGIVGFIDLKGRFKGHENLMLIGGIILTFFACHRLRAHTHKHRKPPD